MDWGNAAQIASALIAIAAFIIAMSTRRSDETRKAFGEVTSRIKDAEQDVDALQTRMHTVEEHIRHLPAADTTHRLEKSIVELQGQLAVVSERLRPVAAISDRLQDFLIEQSRHPR